MTIQPPPPSGMYEMPDGGSTLAAEPRKVIRQETKNKTVFAGRIDIDAGTNVYRTPWAGLIEVAKTSLACWNVDTQIIWERFLTFNRARGNAAVPEGFLLGFMRKWRTSPDAAVKSVEHTVPTRALTQEDPELHGLIAAVPCKKWQFHASDLCCLIGQAACEARVSDVVRRFGCPRFAATLAVHSRAVLAGEISR